ncbi:LPS export ABC transporter periplasmic protein LptC [Seminibacterium arietis]|uniref:Lipopolysaccharide export system protein LptC n=1 Tax=Seminibacterium arietis TaxID=1173502 RepID=A0ABW3I7N1_9PAST
MNIRLNIILLLVVLVLSTWFYQLNKKDDKNLSYLIKSQDAPEYVGQRMKTLIYSPTGKKQYAAQADKVAYFHSDKHTEFTYPVVYLFDLEDEKLGNQSWKISADKAKITQNDMLYLEGNVVAENLLPHSRLQKLATQSAVVNLKTQDISSDTTATISGLNFNSTGSKLVGNLQKQIATLKEQVKTHYEIK